MKKRSISIIIFTVLALNLIATDIKIIEYIKASDFAKVDSLLRSDASVTYVTDETNKTPLFWAVIGNQPEILELLIKHGSDVNAKEVSSNVPLYYAARYGYYECAKLLIENGANADELIKGRTTPLMIACGIEGNGGSLDVVKLLVENGANVNGANNSCWPLRMSARKGFVDIIDYLLENNALLPENEEQLNELLENAVKSGSVTLYQSLLKTSVSLHTDTESNTSLLHQACNSITETDQIVQDLISKGFDVNLADNYGYYPVHYAAENENYAIVKNLIKNGADINVRSFEGKTAYNIIHEKQNQSILDLLNDANVDTSDPKFPLLQGEFMGQKLDLDSSQTFLLGIVNKNRNAHATMVFSPDGKEAYWKLDNRILCSKLENNQWSIPFYPSFSPKDVWCDVPFVSPDNTKIFFNSRKPVSEGASDIKENIWYAERKGNDWSEPKPLPQIVNKSQLHWQISVDLRGNVYFAARRADSKGGADIYCSKYENGEYKEPVNIGDSINTKFSETCPFISPGGDYIIYTRIDPNTTPRVSLYINFLLSDGTWGNSVNLNDYISFKGYGLCSYVSYNQEYIFYLDQYSGKNTVYWSKADFINQLRPK